MVCIRYIIVNTQHKGDNDDDDDDNNMPTQTSTQQCYTQLDIFRQNYKKEQDK